MTSRLQGATKQGPNQGNEAGPHGACHHIRRTLHCRNPLLFQPGLSHVNSCTCRKGYFQQQPIWDFFVSHNLTHIHAVQNAAPLPCAVSYCPFQCACSCSQRKVYDLQCLLGDWTVEGEPDRHIVVVSHGGNLLHLSLHQHHVSR